MIRLTDADDAPSELARLAAEANLLALSLRGIVRARTQALLPTTSSPLLRAMQHDAERLVSAAGEVEAAVNTLLADAEKG